MRILSLDPATHNTGLSLLSESGELIEYCNLYGSGSNDIERSVTICRQLDDFLSNREITIVVLEDILLNKFVPNLNACRSLIRLQGMILGTVSYYNIPFEIYTANHWKSVVGILTGPEGKNRQAQKDRAIKLVKNKYGIDVDDNQADAICIGLSYLVNNKFINIGELK